MSKTVKDNEKVSVFKRMWEIIRDTSRKMSCKISEVSKSIALKMAYEVESNYEIERKKESVELKNYSRDLKRVVVGKGRVFSTERSVEFITFYGDVRVFDVLYIEKNRDIYEYFYVNENYEIVSLTKSHFGFKNTAIWETMLLNYEKNTGLIDGWENFFMKMEENYNY
jgi:hypothetical protein